MIRFARYPLDKISRLGSMNPSNIDPSRGIVPYSICPKGAVMFEPRKKKYQKGFTLVEVIVVAVIVAALAAVAVPLYLGYVESSRKNAAANTAGSVASFCGACRNGGGQPPAAGRVTTASITCTNPALTPAPTIQIPADIIVTLVAGNPPQVQARHAQSDSSSPAAISASTSTFSY